MFKNKNVVVAGSCGLVGTHLTNRLVSLGANVRGTINNTKPLGHTGKVEYLSCDLSKKEGCRASVQGMDYLFLMASYQSGASEMNTNPMVHVTPNLQIALHMLEAAYDFGVKKVMWLSSTTGYPDAGSDMLQEGEMFNSDPYEKYYFAGWTWRFIEILCNMYSKLDRPMPCIVLRPTNIYGPYDKFAPPQCHVLPALIRKIVERHDPIEVWGDGNDIRDFIYVDDVVDAIMLAMEKVNAYDPINLGGPRSYSVKEVLDIILQLDDYREASVTFNSDRPSTIPIRKVNTAKAHDVLGFVPKTSIEEGLRNSIDYYRGISLSAKE